MSQGQKKKSAVWGFTLIELLVASTIFIVVSMVVVSIFLMAIRNQRRDFQVQNLQDNARYMIEFFSKETRMLTEIMPPTSSSRLQIKNQGNPVTGIPEVVIYRFRNGNLERNISGSGYQVINSNDVVIDGAFYVFPPSGEPKMVTIVMTFSPKVSSTGTKPGSIKVQNTIAVRIY